MNIPNDNKLVSLLSDVFKLQRFAEIFVKIISDKRAAFYDGKFE